MARKLEYDVNLDKNLFFDVDNISYVTADDQKPSVFLDENIILCLNLYDKFGVVSPCLSSDTFDFAIDTNFLKTDALMVSGDNSKFNNISDWSDVNPLSGKICCKIFFDSATCSGKIGGESSITPKIQIRKTDISGDKSFILLDNFTLKNTII